MRLLAFIFHVAFAYGEQRTVVVTGATGRTGSLFYHRLKNENLWNVRAFVRNATKAKGILGCTKCDESEGVFVGDLTKPASLNNVMKGADVLAIFTSSAPQCHGIPIGPFGNCSYPQGAEPKAIDWLGTKVQVEAFAMAGGISKSKQILYMSTMGTTKPDNFLDKLAKGYTCFYHLQAEMSVMSSGIPFTIIKACGLMDGEGGKNKFSVGHDDDTYTYIHQVKRDDVARVFVEAVRNPAVAARLRFDLCAYHFGKPPANIAEEVFKPARYPWDTPRVGSAQALV